MIFQTPKKLISVVKAFVPAWQNFSPAHLFTTSPTREETVLLEPPAWPAEIRRDEWWEDGGPIHPQRRMRRCYGKNNSFHHSLYLKQLEANRAYCAYQKKRVRYEEQQEKVKEFNDRMKSVPLSDLVNEANIYVGGSTDDEDRIFLAELARLRGHKSNIDQLEERHARDEYVGLRARNIRVAPSFSTFRRQRKEEAIRRAAAKHIKRQNAQRTPSMEKEEAKRLEAERKRKEVEDEDERRREERRAYVQKTREKMHREEIRHCLEQGHPIPNHLQHRLDLIQEIKKQIFDAARFKEQEALRQAEEERGREFARKQEAQRRAAAARLEAGFETAYETALREQLRRQQEDAREHAQQAAREAEARRAQEEAARRAQEEARRAAEQEQARLAAQAQQTDFLAIYDAKWAALRGIEVYSDITFEHFPWPILGIATDISAITLDAVKAFYTLRGMPAKAMRNEILKWHPDKLHNQLHQVHPEHRERVREAGELIAKFLNNIKEG
ncbi:hypothetical protein H0H92_002416 [Tricholoma furcatifolium]|nr:hypothetical protein H0H92_002416 [Tricholoma furcatifolium]